MSLMPLLLNGNPRTEFSVRGFFLCSSMLQI